MFGYYTKWKQNRKKKQMERKARLAAGQQQKTTDIISDGLDTLIIWDIMEVFSKKDPETKPSSDEGGQFGGGGASGSWITNDRTSRSVDDNVQSNSPSFKQTDTIEPIRNNEFKNIYSSNSYSTSVTGTSDNSSSIMDTVGSVVSSLSD